MGNQRSILRCGVASRFSAATDNFLKALGRFLYRYHPIRVVVDSWYFFRYSVAHVASFYPAGDPVELFPFNNRTLVFTTASACHHVLKDPAHSMDYRTRFGERSGLRKLGMLDCGLIWNNDLTKWKETRCCFQRGLNDRTFREVADSAEQVVDLVMRNVPMHPDKGVHMMHALRWVTLNFTLAQLLGLSPVETWDRALGIIEAIVAYFKAWEFFLVRPTWCVFWRRREHRVHLEACERLHRISEELICNYEEELRRRENGGPSAPRQKGNTKPCCMSHAHARYESGCLTRKDLVQFVLEVLLAGVDTSSVTMFYCLGYLSESPEWTDRVLRELDDARPGDESPVLKACLKESMRLKPVGPVIMRRADAPKDTIDGVPVRRGDQIVLHLAAMNMHEVGGRDPGSFDPGRFLRGEEFGFYPFGAGPKGCVGQYLAMEEMVASMRHLLRGYEVAYTGSTMEEMETNWDIAQQPQRWEEMHMKVRRRRKRVYFVGPSSTGKTTMLRAVAAAFPEAAVHSEIARTLLEEHNWTRQDLEEDANADFQRMIIEEYARLQKGDPGGPAGLELFDRSAVDAVFYCQRLLPQTKARVAEELRESKHFKDCLARYQDPQESLFLLFPVVNETRKDDGVRLLPSTLEEHAAEQRQFENLLQALGVKYFNVTEDLGVREEQVRVKIRDWKAEL